MLPKRLRRRVNALQAVSVELGDSGPTVASAVLAELANACRESELVTFDYGDRRGDTKARKAEPYRLVHAGRRWYLLAYDLDRADWRTFRVDRIQGMPRAHGRFKPRPLPADDVAAYVSRNLSANVYAHQARITVHAPASEVSRRWSGLAGQIEPISANRCRVTTGGPTLEALAFHVGFLGLEFEVHEPPELIAQLRKLSARLARGSRRNRKRTASQ